MKAAIALVLVTLFGYGAMPWLMFWPRMSEARREGHLFRVWFRLGAMTGLGSLLALAVFLLLLGELPAGIIFQHADGR